MPLTTTQLQSLKTAILAETDPEFVSYRTNGQNTLMRDWLNAAKVPAVKAWNSEVAPATSDEVTPWTAFDGLTAGKRESWVQFFAFSRDFSKNAIRKWVTDIWGNATAASNAEAILTGGLRDITRAEAALGGSATAATGVVTAIKLTWEGAITDTDVGAALAS